jgi:large subunit ribosomal protein L29
MKVSDMKALDAKQIDSKVKELRVELFNLRMQKSASGVEKPHRFKEIKKDIARLLTVKAAR